MPITPAEAQTQIGTPLNAPIVSVVDAPGGGFWALGADGGVFALGGAPFYGNYLGLAPEKRLGERSFVRIEQSAGGGYQLISNRGEVFAAEFQPPPGQAVPATPIPPPAAPPPPGLTEEEKSAKGTLNKILADAGLAGLGDWLWGRYLEVGEAQSLLDLRERPEYAQRFPAAKALRDKGRAMSEAEMISYEKNAASLFRRHGLPEGFYDQPDDFTTFLTGEVSLSELGDRIQLAGQMAFRSPVEDRVQLERLYGIGAGGLTAFFLDPNRAQPILERQALAAQTAGVAQRTGFGLLTREEAERLADLGISGEQAAAGFGELIRGQELFRALPGEVGAEITREQQLAATFQGSEAERERIRRRAAQRVATFGGGGQFAATQEGVAGLGGT